MTTTPRIGSRNDAEDEFAFQLHVSRLDKDLERQARFHPGRKWRADFLFHGKALIVEIDGGLFTQGAHSRGAGREKDYERDAAAMILGYRVLRVSPRQVTQGLALSWCEQLLRMQQVSPRP